MIKYIIEVDYERSITLHLDIPLYNTQIFINDTAEQYMLGDDTCVDTIGFHNMELWFSNKFVLFKDELKKVKGIDSIDFSRFEIAIFKGKLFDWENIINDILYLLLCFYDADDGKAEMIEFKICGEAKKQIKSKIDLFKKQFPKKYKLEI